MAPLLSEGEPLGALVLYHAVHFEWTTENLALLEQLAVQAATVMRNAQNYSQMATWAAQLQSIQQLGSRLTRLGTVGEIGQAICAELNQLIDFHNVRVYRIEGADCLPVAWRGEIGEYEGEDMEQLRVKVGEGITGWVARYGLAQNVGDAANDRRARTIPGTEDDLDESLLLAPMLYEDEVIGVIVLAKLGLQPVQLATICGCSRSTHRSPPRRWPTPTPPKSCRLSRRRSRGSSTASASCCALPSRSCPRSTPRSCSRRSPSASRRWFRSTTSASTSTTRERASCDRSSPAASQATEYMAMVIPDDQGVGGYVLRTGDAQLVQDQLADERVVHFAELGPGARSDDRGAPPWG